ncbi:MAG: hypothetical protein AAFX01_03730 [Cyanobacteria bacterium J06638_28]
MAGTYQQGQDLVMLVDKFISARNITHHQYRQLSTMVLADGSIDEHERQQINRLFDAIQAGMVRIVD